MRLQGTSRLQGVLGSQKNGVQEYREQGAWDQKTRGQGAKGSNLGSMEHKILGIVSKNLTRFLGFFFASLRLILHVNRAMTNMIYMENSFL